MADKALALYTGSSSTFNLDEIPQAINLVSENTFVREEARAVMMVPLVVIPPLLSGGKWRYECAVHCKDQGVARWRPT